MKKLAILGPGVVGGSCAEILLRDADLLERNAGEQLELSYVLARRALPDRPYKDKVVTDFSVIEHDADVFLVIETIGGCGAALEYVRRALAAGKHVVTANKQLIAEHGAELLALLGQMLEILRALLEKDESITIGDDTIYRSYERGKQARGRRVVGNPALL